ncbi:D-sedoheptulose 7-phosphate isomerase [Photobacterium sanguinicancri]|uniref:Phosphoheptose isomerase n=1 Tax=Photobacterium sanguinicancri TaxID=875932 RepID=A0AAW7YBB9_9GAMM|nr:D-sedoheptulose 7-phosphate isomerase [Photobacterium sanguinicancri]KXI22411.1 phosphoheptose isomerase [Photobacterium sanguinicancri]MDO6500876.1 D-sedoheptulose 7-phosphate isomerase [Photobacterium sanguinicancri]MDO6544799.1 D-sedoheptulose 7-phosphate isomerase [Photobacterium sanguinicancri]OZS43202.1 phosphoheptose isomerase [Photobacterium sanguinicancri]
MYQDLIRAELTEAADVLNHFLSDDKNMADIEAAAKLLAASFKQGGKVLSCGNGGSHCDAMHFAEELTGRYRENRPGYPGIAISDPSHLSCVSNDFGYDYVFSRYLEAVGSKGDVLFGLSTSGNSGNILKAIEAAHAKGMKVIALTGKDGGKMAGLADVEIRVPHFGFADRIQEVHIKIIHILIMLVEKEMVAE